MEEQIKLLERQKILEEQLRMPGLFGLSVSDTIFQVTFYLIPFPINFVKFFYKINFVTVAHGMQHGARFYYSQHRLSVVHACREIGDVLLLTYVNEYVNN